MTTSKLILPLQQQHSALLQQAAPKITSILSSHLPQHHFPILTKCQLSHTTLTQQQQQQHRKAAILLPILDLSSSNTSSPSILFTIRSQTLTENPNQICFPGGHHDATLDGDSLIRTALREAKEELSHPSSNNSTTATTTTTTTARDEGATTATGESSSSYDWNTGIQIVGQTASIPSPKGIPVTPVLAILQQVIPDHPTMHAYFPGNPSEVSRVFCVSVRDLLEGEGTAPLERLGEDGPIYETEYGTIWGLTAIVLRPILHQILKPVFFPNG